MASHTQPPDPKIYPHPKYPEIVPPLVEPDELPVPEPEENPEIIPPEDPFENPPPYEVPAPGEGP